MTIKEMELLSGMDEAIHLWKDSVPQSLSL